MAHEYWGGKPSTRILAAAASGVRDAVKPWPEFGQTIQQAFQLPSSVVPAAMAEVGRSLSNTAEQYLGVLGRIGFEGQFGIRLPKLEFPVLDVISAGLQRQARMAEALDASGWLPHHSMPLAQVEACAGDGGQAIRALLCSYYSEQWEAVRRATETRLIEYSLDDEANETFREALTAHEHRLYRSVSRLLFPEIERVARKELHGDRTRLRIASQSRLRELAGDLPVSAANGAGFYGLNLYRRLSSHLYESVTDDDARQRFAGDPVPNRHAAVHGLVEYSSMQNSLNAIFMTDFVFLTISWLRSQGLLTAEA